MLCEGAAAARTPDAAPRRQPDDPVRALDGRDRRADRRQGPRRRRHERAQLEPGARDPRRDRDRDHGDGARPRSPRPSPTVRTRPSRHLTRELRRRLRLASIATVAISWRQSPRPECSAPAPIYSRWTAPDWLLARIQSVLDYIQNPDTFALRASRAGSATSSSSTGSCRCSNFLVETPWFIELAGLTAIALVVSGRRPALTTFLMLGLIGVIGRVGAGDGHRLAGARRDGARGRDRARARHLGGREPAILAARCGP